MINQETQLIILKDILNSISLNNLNGGGWGDDANNIELRKIRDNWRLNIKNVCSERAASAVRLSINFVYGPFVTDNTKNRIYLEYSLNTQNRDRHSELCCTSSVFNGTKAFELEDPNSISNLITIIKELLQLDVYRELNDRFHETIRDVISKVENEKKIIA